MGLQQEIHHTGFPTLYSFLSLGVIPTASTSSCVRHRLCGLGLELEAGLTNSLTQRGNSSDTESRAPHLSIASTASHWRPPSFEPSSLWTSASSLGTLLSPSTCSRGVRAEGAKKKITKNKLGLLITFQRSLRQFPFGQRIGTKRPAQPPSCHQPCWPCRPPVHPLQPLLTAILNGSLRFFSWSSKST